jgi:hypothetical protein
MAFSPGHLVVFPGWNVVLGRPADLDARHVPIFFVVFRLALDS